MRPTIVAVVTRLFVDTHGRTEILQERQTILATEIHEFHSLEERVEIHTVALWIVALLGLVEVVHQDSRNHFFVIGNSILLDRVSSYFHERRDAVRPLLDEADHKWVIPQTQFPQVSELN